MVLLHGAAQRVEEAALDVALKLQVVLKVRALRLLEAEVRRNIRAAALALVAKAEQRRHAMREYIVTLVIKFIAIGVLIALCTRKNLCAISRRIAIRSPNLNRIAEVSSLPERLRLLTLASDTVARQIMPVV